MGAGDGGDERGEEDALSVIMEAGSGLRRDIQMTVSRVRKDSHERNKQPCVYGKIRADLSGLMPRLDGDGFVKASLCSSSHALGVCSQT